METTTTEMNPLYRALASGWTTTEALGITQEHVEALYGFGRAVYGGGHYTRAREIFQLLCLYGPSNPRHWFALGAACQLSRAYEPALRAYAMAAVLDPKAPEPHLHAAECFFVTGRVHSARRAIRTALRYAQGRFDKRDVISRAQSLEQALPGPERKAS